MRIGTIFGVRITVHWLFLGILGVAAGLGFFPQTLLVVCSLLAHEIAHFAVARLYDVEIEEIEFLPFGGVARSPSAGEMDPQAESAVAMAGPLNSFFLATLAQFIARWPVWDPRLVHFFYQTNSALTFVNLLPALPLDGGRIVRSLLSRRYGYGVVTRLMAGLGRIFGVGLFGLGLLPLLRGEIYLNAVILGVFVFVSATREREVAIFRLIRQVFRKGSFLRQAGVLPGQPLVATESTPLGEVLRHFVARRYHLVTVVDHNLRTLGTLTESELVEAFGDLGPGESLGEVLRRARS